MLCYNKHMLMINSLDVIDSSCELFSIYAINFVVNSCLVPLIDVRTSDVIALSQGSNGFK